MNLHEICFNFQKKNIIWPITNIIFVFIYYPLEMLIFGFLLGKIFSKIGDAKKNINSIFILLGIIVSAYIFLEILGNIKEKTDSYYFPRMEHNIRLQIIDLIFNKLSINYESINNGEFVGRLLKIPNVLSFFYERLNKTVLPITLSIIGICLYFLIMKWKLGILSIILFSINIFVFFKVCQKNIQKSKNREKNENKVIDDIDDSLHNSFSIITCDRINQEKNRLDKIHSEFDIIYDEQMTSTGNVKFVAGFLNVITFLILSAYIIYLYKNNQISNSLTITFIIILIFLIKQIRFNIPRACEMFVFWGAIKENNQYLSSLISDITFDGHIDNIDILGKIEFKNVTFSYPNSDQIALNNVSFKVNYGENVAIIGKSASGKTSIIKLLLGFYKPTKGEILIDGVNVNEINKKFLRKKISIVHQNVKLFNRSVIDNIAFGTNYKVSDIKEKLKDLKVMEVFKTLPDGLNTMAGKYGDNLSGGQKQIVYMLRCYFRQNPIILLDEPTSAIDQYHKKFVMEMIQELSKNSTCIIVSHDPSIYNSDMFPIKFGIDLGVLKPLK